MASTESSVPFPRVTTERLIDMKEIQPCIGLPLIALDCAEPIGNITHFVTDPIRNRVVGLVLSEEGSLLGKKACLFEEVAVFGPDMVILDTIESVRPLSRIPELLPFLDPHRPPSFRQAWTSDGQRLGRFIEHAFDERTAQVLAFRLELIGSAEPVILSHTALVSAGKALSLFLREAVLPASAVEELPIPPATLPVEEAAAPVPTEDRIFLIQGTDVQPVQEEVRMTPVEAIVEATSEVMEAAEEAPVFTPMDEFYNDIRPFVATKSENEKVRDLFHGHKEQIMPLVIGKVADREITDGEGAPIVTVGQPISRYEAETAWSHSKLYDLFLAAQSTGRYFS